MYLYKGFHYLIIAGYTVTDCGLSIPQSVTG